MHDERRQMTKRRASKHALDDARDDGHDRTERTDLKEQAEADDRGKYFQETTHSRLSVCFRCAKFFPGKTYRVYLACQHCVTFPCFIYAVCA